jgi:flagellar biosynthetic protein FliQ
MTQETVLTLGQGALVVLIALAAPSLLLSLVVGLAISIFQAVTQINEMTLTFIPKAAAVIIGLVLLGPWMLALLTDYTTGIFMQIATVAR